MSDDTAPKLNAEAEIAAFAAALQRRIASDKENAERFHPVYEQTMRQVDECRRMLAQIQEVLKKPLRPFVSSETPMKVVCVMCGVLIRELPPLDKDDTISGVCEACKEKIGSPHREPDSDKSQV